MLRREDRPPVGWGPSDSTTRQSVDQPSSAPFSHMAYNAASSPSMPAVGLQAPIHAGTRAPWGGDPAAGTRAPWAAGGCSAVIPGHVTLSGMPALSPAGIGGLSARGRDKSMPEPVTPRLPAQQVQDASQLFVKPTKRITSVQQLTAFLASQTARDFVDFILALNEAVKGRSASDPCEVCSYF